MKKRTAISNALSLSGRTDLATDFAIYVERQEAIDAATAKLVEAVEALVSPNECCDTTWAYMQRVRLENIAKAALAELKEASK